MFSGIITQCGRIQAVFDVGLDRTLTLAVADPHFWHDVHVGDSLAVNGCCLTVVTLGTQTATVQLTAETLRCTTLDQCRVGDTVHLEKSLLLSDRVHGHLVQGHVDGIGIVTRTTLEGLAVVLEVALPLALAKYVVEKGSITLNGVSLTLNRVQGADISIHLIPHTQQVTTLTTLQKGDSVNVETDMLAKYLYKMMHPYLEKSHDTFHS